MYQVSCYLHRNLDEPFAIITTTYVSKDTFSLGSEIPSLATDSKEIFVLHESRQNARLMQIKRSFRK